MKTTVGYSGGDYENPTYDEVNKDITGHAKCVKIEYDPELTNVTKLLKHYFAITDPTTLNRQKKAIGSMFRSVLFYSNDDEKKKIIEYINSIRQDYKDPIVTEVVELKRFWEGKSIFRTI